MGYFNGTSYFDPTVIYISLDGFRSDYLGRNVTPCLSRLKSKGIQVDFMKPSFPSITFPNHWTLVTGLYPESHGIVANEFHDPDIHQNFIHKQVSISSQPHWWKGEPIWKTSKRQGKKSAVIMWPGANVHGMEPNYFIPYSREASALDKMDSVLKWLDLPRHLRPQLISVYVPQIDQKGHGGGPNGGQLNSVLSQIDNAVAYLDYGLKQRHLDAHVHLVIVSDHGMAATDPSRFIFYDSILSPSSIEALLPREAWPLFGLRTKPNATHLLDQIYQELTADPRHYTVYRREEMPNRFHYNQTNRIAPILMIPDPGYVIVSQSMKDPIDHQPYKVPKGVHGYDNESEDMRALFIANGPSIEDTKLDPFYNTEVYEFLSLLLELVPAPNNSTGLLKTK
ncbi:alkaline-phosphatase-like protein [Pilobolus umbonatus]|nr:alkaline-phosphatase-like protein [Pilobolus umbonatus]